MIRLSQEQDDHGRRAKLHDRDAFEGMHKAGAVAAAALDYVTEFVQIGVTTQELDDAIEHFLMGKGAVAATKGYVGSNGVDPFPASCCISLNEEVCHGIPSTKRKLKKGDILNIDVTAIVDGWHGDCSRMYAAGKIFPAHQKLMDVTYDSLMRAIDIVRPGARLGDIGEAIQSHAEANRFSVVEMFCGHGVGLDFHDSPNVLHYGKAGTGMLLEEGMIFTIEPMLNQGRSDVKQPRFLYGQPNGWVAVTSDGSRSAQYEHSIGVTSDGCEIFTASPTGMNKYPYE